MARMTTRELRNLIAQLLAGRIGTYRTNNMGVIPAIWVGNDVPTADVTGLEVLIRQSALPMRIEPLFGGDQKIANLEWQVLLVQHDRNKGIEEEMLILSGALPMERDPTYTPGDDNVFEQAAFYPNILVVLQTTLEE